jgi:hypothetical protein
MEEAGPVLLSWVASCCVRMAIRVMIHDRESLNISSYITLFRGFI